MQHYHLHAQAADWEAHTWIYRRLSFAIMRGVAEQFVGRMFLEGDFRLFLFACLLTFVYGHDAQALCVIVIVIDIEYLVWKYSYLFSVLHLHKLLKCTLSRCNPTRFTADN